MASKTGTTCQGNENKCDSDTQPWRRKCGCIRTSDKLKKILNCFPSAPPPTPLPTSIFSTDNEELKKFSDTKVNNNIELI